MAQSNHPALEQPTMVNHNLTAAADELVMECIKVLRNHMGDSFASMSTEFITQWADCVLSRIRQAQPNCADVRSIIINRTLIERDLQRLNRWEHIPSPPPVRVTPTDYVYI